MFRGRRLGVLLAGTARAGFGSILIPAAPLAYEPVFLEIVPGEGAYGQCFDDSRNRVTMAANVIRVDLRFRPLEPPGTNCRTFAGLGSLPAGNYVVEVWYENVGKQGEKQFTVAPMPDPAQGNLRPIINVSGLYWNPQRPGRGMSITQDPLTQNLFAVWYINDQAPWAIKEDEAKFKSVIYNGLYGIDIVSQVLGAFLPETGQKALASLGRKPGVLDLNSKAYSMIFYWYYSKSF